MKRRYDSSRRKERALETRARIGNAARELFAERGYTDTSIAGIAERAGVATDTVFAIFGSKADLLDALVVEIEQTGSAAPIFDALGAALDADDPLRVVALVAKLSRDLAERLLWATEAMIRGGLGDPRIGETWNSGDQRRREAMRRLAVRLKRGRHLAEGMSVERATTILWAHTGPLMYRLLVRDSGWSPARYERWLRETLQQQLLSR